MGEFRELDKAAGSAAETDEDVGRISERMAWYTGKATGTPMRFSTTRLTTATWPIGRRAVLAQTITAPSFGVCVRWYLPSACSHQVQALP